jgi:hypothetical protein
MWKNRSTSQFIFQLLQTPNTKNGTSIPELQNTNTLWAQHFGFIVFELRALKIQWKELCALQQKMIQENVLKIQWREHRTLQQKMTRKMLSKYNGENTACFNKK